MSALAEPVGKVDGWRPPSLWGLTWSVFGGEVLAAVMLWVAGILLGVAAIAPLGGASQWVWLPWRIDGVWAVIGAIGWGYLVCTIVAAFVGQSIERRGFQRPAAAWLRVAIAISGYGAMAVGRTPGAHVAVAVLSGALITRLIAFHRNGSARSWPWALSPRMRLEAILLALVLAFSYSALHPFAADGSGGSYAGPAIYVHPHFFTIDDIGLSEGRVPADITSVTITGPGAAHVKVSSVLLSLGSPNDMHQANAHQRFPYHLPASAYLWISAQVELTSCGFVQLNTLKLHYAVLGIPTGQTIPLDSPLTMRCGPRQPTA